jgi:hypothetical protein
MDEKTKKRLIVVAFATAIVLGSMYFKVDLDFIKPIITIMIGTDF